MINSTPTTHPRTYNIFHLAAIYVYTGILKKSIKKKSIPPPWPTPKPLIVKHQQLVSNNITILTQSPPRKVVFFSDLGVLAYLHKVFEILVTALRLPRSMAGQTDKYRIKGWGYRGFFSKVDFSLQSGCALKAYSEASILI